MDRNMFSNFDGFRQLINYWWLTLLIGVLIFIAGIIVLNNPIESYGALTIFIGLMIIAAGLIQIFGAIAAPKGTGRGWLLLSGAVELVLGIIVTANLQILASIIPFFLAFWLMFRGIGIGVFASDMKRASVKGVGWIIFFAVLLVICSLLIIIFPAIGVGAIIIWLGISFIISGVITIALSFKVRRLRRYLKG